MATRDNFLDYLVNTQLEEARATWATLQSAGECARAFLKAAKLLPDPFSVVMKEVSFVVTWNNKRTGRSMTACFGANSIVTINCQRFTIGDQTDALEKHILSELTRSCDW